MPDEICAAHNSEEEEAKTGSVRRRAETHSGSGTITQNGKTISLKAGRLIANHRLVRVILIVAAALIVVLLLLRNGESRDLIQTILKFFILFRQLIDSLLKLDFAQ